MRTSFVEIYNEKISDLLVKSLHVCIGSSIIVETLDEVGIIHVHVC